MLPSAITGISNGKARCPCRKATTGAKTAMTIVHQKPTKYTESRRMRFKRVPIIKKDTMGGIGIKVRIDWKTRANASKMPVSVILLVIDMLIFLSLATFYFAVVLLI